MSSVIIYRTVPAYLDALRFMVGKVGRKKLFAYENSKYYRVGFQHAQEVYCLDVKTIRGHYLNVKDSKTIKSIVDYYVKDVSKILHEKDNAAN